MEREGRHTETGVEPNGGKRRVEDMKKEERQGGKHQRKMRTSCVNVQPDRVNINWTRQTPRFLTIQEDSGV